MGQMGWIKSTLKWNKIKKNKNKINTKGPNWNKNKTWTKAHKDTSDEIGYLEEQ